MSSEQTDNLLISILESSEDAIIGMNLDRIILTWNDSATRLYKYQREEIVGKSAKILYPPDRQDEMEFLRNKVLNGERVTHYETKRVTKEGQIIDVSLTISPIKNKQGTIIGISTISCDISERKQIEEDNRRLSSLNQAILDNSFYMIISVDKQGVIQTFNRAAERLLGYQANEVIGKATPMLFHDPSEVEEHSIKLTQEFGRPIKGFDVFITKAEMGHYEEKEWNYIRKDGTAFPVVLVPSTIRNGYGEVIGYFGILKDISDKKNLQHALEHNEKRLRTLIDNALDSVITIDSFGVIQSFSLSSEKIFKYSHEEMIGKNIRQLIDDGDADDLLTFLKINHPDFTGISREITCKRRNGNPFAAEVSISKMIIDGSPWYIWITRDITERRKLDRMKREFISTVSHELRTPLTSIKGALGLIASGKTGTISPQSQKLIDIALRNSDRLVRLINDILDIEKIETGNLVYNIDKHDLIPLIKASIEINQPMAQQFDVKLVFDSVSDQFDVAVDPDRLTQVITNLLSNAIKYSPKGEEVHVEVTKMHDIIRVSIIDKGPGIPSDFHSRIFQKFAQVDSSDQRKKGGTGLGLNISKSIIEKFGGSIGYNSQEGKGSTFFFELAECPKEPVSDIKLKINQKKKILHVEDDKDLCRIVDIVLEDMADIEYAHSLAEASEKISHSRYDLILLDLNLPDGSGLSLLRNLGHLGTKTPVIIFAAADIKETIDDTGHVRSTLIKSKTTNEHLRREIKELIDTSNTLIRQEQQHEY